jgi:hypothetical protein
MQAFGEADVLVDTELSVRRMRAMIDSTGRGNFSIHVYPAPVGHSVGFDNEAYWEELGDWWRGVIASRSAREE